MPNALSLLAIVCSGLNIACVNLPAAESPAEQLLNASRPLVIAHRGYCEVAPENTIPSFRLAKTAGADLVELDYHHTKDGQLVVVHDPTLDRTTDAVQKWGRKNIQVADVTLKELAELDAGRWFSPQFAQTRLPTLKEALDEIQKGSVTLIERKGGAPAACLKLLREQHLINQVVVQSFDWDYLTEFHAQEPAQILGALGPPGSKGGRKLTDPEKILSPSWVETAQRAGARVVVWNNQLTPEAVAFAHSKGLKVWVYTINDADGANRLLNAGVDGIISNNTPLIWRTLALRKPAVAD